MMQVTEQNGRYMETLPIPKSRSSSWKGWYDNQMTLLHIDETDFNYVLIVLYAESRYILVNCTMSVYRSNLHSTHTGN